MKTIETTPRYAKAFWDMMSKRTFDAADLNSGRPADGSGAYYLPSESMAKFREFQAKQNVLRTIGTVVMTENADSKVKCVLPVGAAAFIDENGEIPETDGGIDTWTVNRHKIAKISKVSREMAQDAGFDLETALAAEFGREFGKTEEDGCINGDGVNMPFGLLHPTAGAQTGATTAKSDELTFDDLRSLYFAVESQYRRGGAWLMGEETALYLRTLKDNSGRYIWRDSDDTILGKPVYTSPFMSAIAPGAKPVLFGDFSFYWLVERGGVTLKALHEKYALNGIIGYIGTEFVDGRLIRRQAVKALAVKENA
jgi:HK97 family phage major capsid protein